MNLKQKAVTGAVWSAIESWGTQAASLIIFLLLARLLSPKAFGLVALANIYLSFMQIFLDQGFAKALIQRQEFDPEHLDAAFWSQVGFGILLTIVTFFSAGVVAAFFDQPKLILILQCLAPLFIISSLNRVHSALLNREFAFKVIALRSLLGTVISGTVGITMAYLGYGVWSLVTLNIVGEVVGVLVIWGTVDWRPRFSFSWKHFQDLFAFGIQVIAFRFIKFFHKRSDNLLIGYFMGEVALGYYAIAYRVLEVMTQLLVQTATKVALPTFSRLQTEPERFRQLFYQTTQLISIIAFPTFLGAAALTPELVITLFGEKWIPAIGAMRILSLTGIVQSVYILHNSVFISMGKPIWKVKLSLLGAAATVIACLIAVRWNITVVALAFTISNYLIFPVSQWAVNRLIKISPKTYLRKFVTPLITSAVMIGAIFVTKYLLSGVVNPKLLLVLGTAIGALVYVLCLRLFDPRLFQQLWELGQLILFSRKKAT